MPSCPSFLFHLIALTVGISPFLHVRATTNSSFQLVRSWSPSYNGEIFTTYWVCENSPCTVSPQFSIRASCPGGKYTMWIQALNLDFSIGVSGEFLTVTVDGAFLTTCVDLGQACSAGAVSVYEQCAKTDRTPTFSGLSSSSFASVSVSLTTGPKVDCGNPDGTTSNTRLGARIVWMCHSTSAPTLPFLPRSGSNVVASTSTTTPAPSTSCPSSTWCPSNGQMFASAFRTTGTGAQSVTKTITISGRCPTTYAYARVRAVATDFSTSSSSETMTVKFGFGSSKETSATCKHMGDKGGTVTCLSGFNLDQFMPSLSSGTSSLSIQISISSSVDCCLSPSSSSYYLDATVELSCSDISQSVFVAGGGSPTTTTSRPAASTSSSTAARLIAGSILICILVAVGSGCLVVIFIVCLCKYCSTPAPAKQTTIFTPPPTTTIEVHNHQETAPMVPQQGYPVALPYAEPHGEAYNPQAHPELPYGYYPTPHNNQQQMNPPENPYYEPQAPYIAASVGAQVVVGPPYNQGQNYPPPGHQEQQYVMQPGEGGGAIAPFYHQGEGQREAAPAVHQPPPAYAPR